MEKSELLKKLDRMLEEAFVKKEDSYRYGKPVRDTVINNDDICNLKICLNTAKDLKDFLRQT